MWDFQLWYCRLSFFSLWRSLWEGCECSFWEDSWYSRGVLSVRGLRNSLIVKWNGKIIIVIGVVYFRGFIMYFRGFIMYFQGLFMCFHGVIVCYRGVFMYFRSPHVLPFALLTSITWGLLSGNRLRRFARRSRRYRSTRLNWWQKEYQRAIAQVGAWAKIKGGETVGNVNSTAALREADRIRLICG